MRAANIRESRYFVWVKCLQKPAFRCTYYKFPPLACLNVIVSLRREWGSELGSSSNQVTFDYIIVGAGTAGALMANRLSSDSRYRVLLVEAGEQDDYHWIHIPVGYLYCIGNPRTDWLYQTEPIAGLNGRSLRYPRGKTLGGSSSINGMIYMRGQARDYDHWAQLTGDDTWSWDNVLPAFMRHEDHYMGARQTAATTDNDPQFPLYHGVGGEWRVEKQRLRWEILDAFIQAAEQAGIPRTTDFNRGNNEGVGYFEVNQKEGWRWNTAKAFLRPACQKRSNFTLWTSAQATRLNISSRSDAIRCTGVQVRKGREMITAHASREVILSAGSVGSPQLLQLSGIGPATLLRQHGIDVMVDSPGVGANLQDHLQIRAVYKITGAASLNQLASSLYGKAKIGLEYLLNRSGPMSMAPSQLGAFTRSSAAYRWPNLEYHVQPLSLDAFGEPLHRFPAFTASVCNLNPTSRGTVRIKSPRFEDAPSIHPNYLSTEEDRQVAIASLRLTRRIVGQPAMAKFQPLEWKPGAHFDSDVDLGRLAGDIGTTIFHPVGTTKMGADEDPMAVLDARLKVRRVDSLRVVDAGAMPTITSGNTNSPTLMMAEKAAAWVRADADDVGARPQLFANG
jgi:choline dehydrogenase